ncbi:MAG: hypothetical protein JSR70_07605 [Proteobacteria bacterium]|nr:hypothetical protein [Pseudomonadota bacterium]
MNDRRYLSRKFWLAACGWVAGVAFFACGFMTADQWMTQSAFVLGLYLAANVGQKAVDKP